MPADLFYLVSRSLRGRSLRSENVPWQIDLPIDQRACPTFCVHVSVFVLMLADWHETSFPGTITVWYRSVLCKNSGNIPMVNHKMGQSLNLRTTP